MFVFIFFFFFDIYFLLYRECDLDADGLLDQREIQQACKDTGYSDNYDEIRANLKQVASSATGKIDVEEFIDVKFKS